LHLSDAARDYLIDVGYNPDYGARPLRRTIEKHVEDPLAEEMLAGSLPENSLVEIGYKEGEERLIFNAIPAPQDAAEETEEPKAEKSGSAQGNGQSDEDPPATT
jgi:ATP-dependent Clp protease ATP-binding subunit ClpC